MRTVNSSESELIFYIRQNIAGRKISKYKRIKVKNPRLVNSVLSKLMGKIGEVKKIRTLYLKENIRFHLDEVIGLGNFIEVEYILPKNERRELAEKKVDDIIKILKIKKKDFIDVSYMDIINKSKKKITIKSIFGSFLNPLMWVFFSYYKTKSQKEILKINMI